MTPMTPSERLDAPPLKDGDDGFDGVIARGQVEILPRRILADGFNIRCRTGEAETRKGVVKPGWANRCVLGDNATYPWGRIDGAVAFLDPSSVAWIVFAADGMLFRCRENNAPYSMPMPAASVSIVGPCTFTQAFNKLFCWRGKNFNPLLMPNIDTGWTDVLEYWKAGTSYALNKEVAFGPAKAVSSMTGAGGVVTVVTTTSHGYATGLDVVVMEATNAEYNGRFAITVIDEITFTYAANITHASAGGTPFVSDMSAWYKVSDAGGAAPDESPRTNAAKWTQIHNIIPRADDAIYINNRLLIPTWLTPLADGFATGNGGYTKKDFIVASDVQDEIHTDFVNEFRINQGSDDEIITLEKFNDATVLVFKTRSWGILYNIALDLSNVSLDMRNREYGASAARATVVNGVNCYFVAEKRGVVSLQQSENSKTMNIDVPLSYDIQPYIDRINWHYADKIRTALWDNKLYVAVPLGAAQNKCVVPGPKVYLAFVGLAFYYTLVPGRTYQWLPGPNDGQIESGVVLDGAGSFTPTFASAAVTGASGDEFTGELSTTFSGVNNAILVYDFQKKLWTGYDTGSALMVKEFFIYPVGRINRLFFVGEDGFFNLVEESLDGDQVDGGSAAQPYFEEIRDARITRGYVFDQNGLKRGRDGTITMATFDPKYSITKIESGINRTSALFTDKTKSRTKYTQPYNRPAYDLSNANDDHAVPFRKDYSVEIPTAGLTLDNNGVDLNLFQESTETFDVHAKARHVQFKISNRQGRLKLKTVQFSAVPAPQKKGSNS